MQPILIDDVEKEFYSTQEEVTVDVDGVLMKGYQIAKPMNYDPEYFTEADRRQMADLILSGKAIAVQFFRDLTPDQQSAYVKQKIQEHES